MQGTNTLTLDDSADSNSVTGSLDTTQIPVNQLVSGQPVFDGGAASPVARFYFGGEPVIDPFTHQALVYSGGQPVLNLLTGQPEFDPYGNPILHKAGDPVLHIAGDPVVHQDGDTVLYLGGELVRDENGNLVNNSAVMTGSPTLSFAPAQGANLATITRSAGNWLFDGFVRRRGFPGLGHAAREGRRNLHDRVDRHDRDDTLRSCRAPVASLP